MEAVERRRWRRVNCDAVEQGVLLRLETADSAAAVLNTYACDVSLGGLAFEVKRDIALPDPLPLKVFLPHAHTPFDCSSRIAWQKTNEHAIRAGVAFQKLQEDHQRTLKDFLREIGGQTATVEREPRTNLPALTDTSKACRFIEESGLATSVRPCKLVRGEPAEVQETEPPPPQRGSRREQAIWQFEQGVLLYHQRKLGLAKREFQKVLKEYVDVIDVARVARRYHGWSHEAALYIASRCKGHGRM